MYNTPNKGKLLNIAEAQFSPLVKWLKLTCLKGFNGKDAPKEGPEQKHPPSV